MVLLYTSLYCLGCFDVSHEVRTIKVSRIKGLTLLEKTFERPPGFSLAEHFQSAFGVFRSGEEQVIEVRFVDWAATNVREIRWHPSQKILRNGKKTVIARFKLGSTVEFKRWILGFGHYATVLKPASFAKEIRQEHLAAARQDRKRMR